LSDEAVQELWKRFFGPLRDHFPELPDTRVEYDPYILQQIGNLARLLRELNLLQRGQLGEFGVAQKMLNLFIKDHWALDTLQAIQNLFCTCHSTGGCYGNSSVALEHGVNGRA
jgi:hypothetical protein